jgi:alpha/beta superfamily hydrolase
VVIAAGTPGGPALEGQLRAPKGAQRAVLLCHNHPLYGGSMHTPVLLAVAKLLAERGPETTATLRFNFRGVGKSEGTHDHGVGETDDTRAALRFLKARVPNARAITVCGHSFGTWVGLRASALEGGVERACLIAPAVRVFDFVKEDGRLFQGRLAIFLGSEDEYCDVAEAEALARDLGAKLHVLDGFDHLFVKSRRRLAEEVLPFVAPETAP